MHLINTLDYLAEFGKANSREAAQRSELANSQMLQDVDTFGKSLGLNFFEDNQTHKLSAAGKLFSNEIGPISDDLKKLTRKCKAIQNGSNDTIKIQNLAFPLLFDKKINYAVRLCAGGQLALKVIFSDIKDLRTLSAVKEHIIDLGFYADPRTMEKVSASLAEIGIGCVPLRQERFVLRVDKDHPLATKTPLLPLDVLNYPIVVSSSPGLEMLRELLTKAYSRYGLLPEFSLIDTDSYAAFYMTPLLNMCQITDESTQHALMAMGTDTVYRKFDDANFGFVRYFVYDLESCSVATNMFLNAIENAKDY